MPLRSAGRGPRAIALLLLLAIPPGLIAGEKQSAVVVVGAGLSGLNAALLLEEQGYRVTVLEASNRIGGRLHTLDDVPGTPEAGGNVIGPSYARIIDRAREFDVSLEPAPQIAGGRRAMNYFIGGQFIAPGEWASSPQNPFPERLRHMPPGSALFGVLRPNPLQTPADWRGEDVAQYDVPVLGLLEKLGFDQRGQALADHANSYGNSLDDTSLLAMYRIATVYALGGEVPGQPMAVEGGNQRLPEAMARAVRGDVLTGKWVTAINHSDSGVTVKTRDGSAYRADYALVTVPLPALRNITIEPALPALQQRAIYPAAKGTVKLAAVRDWNSDPLAGGSWLRWQPGQITDFAAALARPAGRLFFAGEHTAITNTGMEGAMESAERAVGEILAMSQPAAGSVASGEQLFLHCQGCHSVAQGETHKLGPNLYGFFAQPRATREGYAYSDALKTAGGAWDRGSLREWLLDPQAAVSGNRMIYTNPYSEEDLESLLGYLETLSQ